MKIEQNEDTTLYSITSVDFNEMELIKSSLDIVYKLLTSTELDSLTDNQEKEIRTKRLESILTEIASLTGSQTAESWDATIIQKAVEKHYNAH